MKTKPQYDLSTFGGRLAYLMGDMTFTELSRRTSISDVSLGKYTRGEQIPNIETIQVLADTFGVTLDWLIKGKGPMRAEAIELKEKDVVWVPAYDVDVAAGSGTFVEEDGQPTYLPLPRLCLQQFGTSFTNMSVVRVYGDSMTPSLSDGDLAIVDLSFKDFRTIKEGIYVLRNNGVVQVKRLQRLHNGCIKLISDNKFYETEKYNPKDLANNDLVLLGKVVGVIRKVG